MRPSRRISLLALAASLVVAACDPLFFAGCTDELGMRTEPADPVVDPGESFVATIELTTCGGRKQWRPTVLWRALDTTVVRVDSLTGRVTARASGVTDVIPSERRGDGSRVDYLPVRVRVQ
jgi:hypothetical protein